MAIGVWSFCQEVEKKFSWHSLPASWEGPAFELMRNLPASRTDLRDASRTCDQMNPATKSTSSDLTSLSDFCLPVSGLKPSSS